MTLLNHIFMQLSIDLLDKRIISYIYEIVTSKSDWIVNKLQKRLRTDAIYISLSW